MFIVCCSPTKSLVSKDSLQLCLRSIVHSNSKITLFLLESFYNAPLTFSWFSLRTSFVYWHVSASRLQHDYTLVPTRSLVQLKWFGTNRSLQRLNTLSLKIGVPLKANPCHAVCLQFFLSASSVVRRLSFGRSVCTECSFSVEQRYLSVDLT